MRSISIESTDGIFEGTIMLFVHDTHHLDKFIKKVERNTWNTYGESY